VRHQRGTTNSCKTRVSAARGQGKPIHPPRFDWTERYPRISAAVAALQAASAVIDGEAVPTNPAASRIDGRLRERSPRECDEAAN
jgi:hypothetical protein